MLEIMSEKQHCDTQRAHNVIITSLWSESQNKIRTFWCNNHVIITSCIRCVKGYGTNGADVHKIWIWYKINSWHNRVYVCEIRFLTSVSEVADYLCRHFPDSKVHGAHLGPVGPRWAPCWNHEPCYQGLNGLIMRECGCVPILVFCRYHSH